MSKQVEDLKKIPIMLTARDTISRIQSWKTWNLVILKYNAIDIPGKYMSLPDFLVSQVFFMLQSFLVFNLKHICIQG